MKTVLVSAALMGSLAAAKLHGHNRRAHPHPAHKRDLVVEWYTETVIETVTAYVDESTTELVFPSTTQAIAVPTPEEASTTAQVQVSSTAAVATTFMTSAAALVPSVNPVVPDVSTAISMVSAISSALTLPVSYATSAEEPTTTAAYTVPASSATASPSSGGGGLGSLISGDLTYYTVGLGSCGFDDTGKDDTENIVAISVDRMGSVSNGNTMCNEKINIKSGGKTVQATVRDKCMGCQADAIDCSTKVFQDLGISLDTGRIQVEWEWAS